MESMSKTQYEERGERWPALPFEAWQDTRETLHMWTQIVGKVRMELSPPVNHWWHVTLYVTPRGLTTSAIPYPGGTFAIDAHRFWRILVQVDTVLKEFRSHWIGKSSPVHFFWGSFDLAVTRFSGRRAPERPGADRITREAYSHEVISCGFWPGDATFQAPAFYSYTAPEPPGIEAASLRPGSAWYSPDKGLFLLRYDDVRSADAPEQVLQEFLQSTYEALERKG